MEFFKLLWKKLIKPAIIIVVVFVGFNTFMNEIGAKLVSGAIIYVFKSFFYILFHPSTWPDVLFLLCVAAFVIWMLVRLLVVCMEYKYGPVNNGEVISEGGESPHSNEDGISIEEDSANEVH